MCSGVPIVKPGHKDCPHEVTVIRTIDCRSVSEIIDCDHAHIEDILADNGPVVGHYCYCCGNVWIDQDYVMKGQQ